MPPTAPPRSPNPLEDQEFRQLLVAYLLLPSSTLLDRIHTRADQILQELNPQPRS